MGSSQDIMHQFARQEINRFFSTFDGWKITALPETAGYDREFIAERIISGTRQKNKVLVTFEKKIDKEKLEKMRSSVTGPYGGVQKSDILLIVPQNSDISSVPADIRISFMHSFTFEGDSLVWIKKPGTKTSEGKVKATV